MAATRPVDRAFAQARALYDTFLDTVAALPKHYPIPSERHVLKPSQLQDWLAEECVQGIEAAGGDARAAQAAKAAYESACASLQAACNTTNAGMRALGAEHGCSASDLYEELNRRAFAPANDAITLKKDLNPRTFEEARQTFSARGQHLVACFEAQPTGVLSYTGVCPLANLLATGVQVGHYLPNAADRALLRAGKVVTSYVAVPTLPDWQQVCAQSTASSGAGAPRHTEAVVARFSTNA